MKKRLLTIVAATLLAPCFALADDAVTPAPAPVIEASKDGFKTLVDNEKTARTDLRTKEASAAAAINADTTLTAEQKAEKLAESRKDYKAQAKAMQQKYVADKKAMRAEIKNDRVEARKADGAKTGGRRSRKRRPGQRRLGRPGDLGQHGRLARKALSRDRVPGRKRRPGHK